MLEWRNGRWYIKARRKDASNILPALTKPTSFEETPDMATDQSIPPPAPAQPIPDVLRWPYPVAPADVAACITYVGAPLGKGRPRFGRKGQVYTPEQTRKYEKALRDLFAAEVGIGAAPDGTSRFALRCFFVRPNRQRIDCDNMVKAASDAATGVVWGDDSQVQEVIGRMWYRAGEGRATVLIHRVPDDSPKDRCQQCGVEIKSYPSRKSRTCSNACRLLLLSVEHTCSECKQAFRIAPSKRKRPANVYCGRACSIIALRRRMSARKGAHLRRCEDCGAPVTRREYERCAACSMAKREPTSNYWTRSS